MGAMMAGQLSALTPDYVKAKIAAGRMFKLFNRVPVIQSDSEEGLQPVSITPFIQNKSMHILIMVIHMRAF
jgi:hypothetical protein